LKKLEKNMKRTVFSPFLCLAVRKEVTHKIPAMMVSDPKKAAGVIERMIGKRKKKVFVYRWMLWLMKTKQFLT
jgi:hypothetical protein